MKEDTKDTFDRQSASTGSETLENRSEKGLQVPDSAHKDVLKKDPIHMGRVLPGGKLDPSISGTALPIPNATQPFAAPTSKIQKPVKPNPATLKISSQNAPVTLGSIILDMNKKHAVINVSGKCQILNEIKDPIAGESDFNLSSVNDFKKFYANKFKMTNRGLVNAGTGWLESEYRREYKGFVFEPGKPATPGYFNLWRGFPVKPKPGDWSLFRHHIVDVICDGNQTQADWVIAWLARILQDPGGKRPGTAIVLRGKQGTGKGIFVNYFGKLLGKHFVQIAQAGQITGRFNNHLKDIILAFVDEGFWAGDQQARGVLKSMITEPFFEIEQKGKDIIRVKNHLNLIVASNSEWVIPAGLEERRFFVLDVSDKRMQDHTYFKDIVDQMENGGLEAMFHDMLNLDISAVNLREFEQTAALFEQKLNSMTTVQKYWYERLLEGQQLSSEDGTIQAAGWEKEVSSHEQYEDYCQFAKKMNERNILGQAQFGININKLCPNITKKKNRSANGDRIMVRVYPDLDECRKAFEALVKTSIDWS